jgi:DNA-binding phage protein
METEAIMSKVKAAVSHHEAEVAELRADRNWRSNMKAAMESLDDRKTVLRPAVSYRRRGLWWPGRSGGGSRHQPRIALQYAVSHRQSGMKTLLAVLKTVGLRLSVTPEEHAHA